MLRTRVKCDYCSHISSKSQKYKIDNPIYFLNSRCFAEKILPTGQVHQNLWCVPGFVEITGKYLSSSKCKVLKS